MVILPFYWPCNAVKRAAFAIRKSVRLSAHLTCESRLNTNTYTIQSFLQTDGTEHASNSVNGDDDDGDDNRRLKNEIKI